MTTSDCSLDLPQGRQRHRTAVACVALAALVVPAPVMASNKEICVAAHELYQQLSLQRQTTEAREQLVICSDPVCPGLVREDCTQWLVEVDRKLLSVSPQHLAVAASPPPVTQETPQVHTKAMVLSVQAGGSSRSPSRSKSSQAPWIAGTLGIVAIGSAAYFGIGGWRDAETLRRTCAPNCDQSQVSNIRTRLLIADVFLFAGLGFSALTAWLVWDRHSRKVTAPTEGGGGLSAVVVRGGAQLLYSSNF